MRKILLLIVIISIVLLAQKFGLLTYFSNSSKPGIQNQFTDVQKNENSDENNRPIIGIRYRMIDSLTADQNNLIEGAYVTQIIQGSPAEKANLREEDIITKVDGIEISGGDEQFLSQLISKKKIGDEVFLEIWRNSEIINIYVPLEYSE